MKLSNKKKAKLASLLETLGDSSGKNIFIGKLVDQIEDLKRSIPVLPDSSPIFNEINAIKNRIDSLSTSVVNTQPVVVNTDDSKLKETEKEIDDIKEQLDVLFRRGGSKPMRIRVNGVDVTSKFADINLIGSITAVDDNVNQEVDITISGGGGGVTFRALTSGTHTETETTGRVVMNCNASGGNIIINMPTAVDNEALYSIKKTDSSANTVTVVPNGSETIDGDANLIIQFQNSGALITSDDLNLLIT